MAPNSGAPVGGFCQVLERYRQIFKTPISPTLLHGEIPSLPLNLSPSKAHPKANLGNSRTEESGPSAITILSLVRKNHNVLEKGRQSLLLIDLRGGYPF